MTPLGFPKEIFALRAIALSLALETSVAQGVAMTGGVVTPPCDTVKVVHKVRPSFKGARPIA